MKKIMLILLLSISGIGRAQNYQCLQSGVTRFFTNSNGYLRAIKIDAANTYPDSVVYFPFHTPRGSDMHALDTNGGSWLGKKVTQLNDGTFIFDNYWSDSVVTIKTQAATGDSWSFYKDTGSLYYEATVVSADTMTILGLSDSVKRIVIHAYNAGGIVATDSLDNFQMILSKNNGFVRVFDLYTFPYHKPDSTYIGGRDVYLDMSLSVTRTGSGRYTPPNSLNQIFDVVDFINPNDQELYNWNVGDILESEVAVDKPEHYPVSDDYILNTVVDKVTTGHVVTYTLNGTDFSCGSHYIYPCTLVSNSGTYSFDDTHYSIADKGYIPESFNSPVLFYFPNDTTNCIQSPTYMGEVYTTSGKGSIIYKKGIGMTHYRLFDEMGQLTVVDLVYSNISGTPCGNYIPSSVSNFKQSEEQVTLLPNPVQNELTISATEKITSIIISNGIGQVIYCRDFNVDKIQVDVAALSAGLYFIKINNVNVRKFVKQ